MVRGGAWMWREAIRGSTRLQVHQRCRGESAHTGLKLQGVTRVHKYAGGTRGGSSGVRCSRGDLPKGSPSRRGAGQNLRRLVEALGRHIGAG